MNKKANSYRSDRITVMIAGVAMVLVSVAAVFVVTAYLSAQSNEKTNKFFPMTYTNTDIVEPNQEFPLDKTQLTQTINKSAVVKNLEGGDKKPVYVRVAVVATVHNTDGENVSYKYPCVVTFAKGSNWMNVGDYYYYTKALMPGASTDELFNGGVTVTLTEMIPQNYRVDVSVIADTVQAVDTDSADRESWTIDPSIAGSVWGESARAVLTTTKELCRNYSDD